MTRWLKYVFNIWPFTAKKLCPISQKCTRVGFKFYQIQNKPSKNGQRLIFFAKIAKLQQIWSQCSSLSLVFHQSTFTTRTRVNSLLSLSISHTLLHTIFSDRILCEIISEREREVNEAKERERWSESCRFLIPFKCWNLFCCERT